MCLKILSDVWTGDQQVMSSPTMMFQVTPLHCDGTHGVLSNNPVLIEENNSTEEGVRNTTSGSIFEHNHVMSGCV